MPSLVGLAQRHPCLRVELDVSDRLADMARDGVDLAIRTASTLPDTVVARQIGTLGRALYAAPAYVAQRGWPREVDELASHQLITNIAVPVYAGTAGARHRLPKIRACIGYWAEWFGRDRPAKARTA